MLWLGGRLGYVFWWRWRLRSGVMLVGCGCGSESESVGDGDGECEWVGKWIAYLIARLTSPHVHRPPLDEPNPQRQRAIQKRVKRDGGGRVVLRILEAELVVPAEAGGADGEGGVAEREAHVAEGVGLLEGEGIEVVGDCVVGGVFEVWGSLVSWVI
jgi:hypothetical protein